MEEAAQALEVQGPLMETLDERGKIHENRTANGTEVVVEEEKKAVMEDEVKIKPGNADD